MSWSVLTIMSPPCCLHTAPYELRLELLHDLGNDSIECLADACFGGRSGCEVLLSALGAQEHVAPEASDRELGLAAAPSRKEAASPCAVGRTSGRQLLGLPHEALATAFALGRTHGMKHAGCGGCGMSPSNVVRL